MTRLADFLKPMLATLTDAPLKDEHYLYELKYDGIRAIIEEMREKHRESSR